MTTATVPASTKPTPPKPSRDGDGRTVVTLSPAAAAAVRRLSSEMGGIGATEVVRRGLMLLDLFLSLPENEELVVRDKNNQQCERLRFAWETF